MNKVKQVDLSTFKDLHFFLDAEEADVDLELINLCMDEAYCEDYACYHASQFVRDNLFSFLTLMSSLRAL